MRLWWRRHNRIYNPDVITDSIFEAFLDCETKSRLKLSGELELWFAKTLADFEIDDIAVLPSLLWYNS
jgi:hypothetical protein